MPTVSVKKAVFERYMGKAYTEDEINDLCFDYGLELDEVTTEKAQIQKELGTANAGDGASEEIIYKIEIPANRYDLLCPEGLCRALLIYLEKIRPPKYELRIPENGQLQKLVISKEVLAVRPHVVAAILRDVTLTDEAYTNFIDLQDKLHQNLCRKRVLVSVGTHDLDKARGPFLYTAKPPSSIKFVPLNQAAPMTGTELMKFYADSHLRHYLPIIENSPVYPIVCDADGEILSLPPIINSDRTKLSTKTKNIFIECTALDLTKAKIVLDVLVTMFSQYCGKQYTVEPVEVVQIDQSVVRYPDNDEYFSKVSSHLEIRNGFVPSDFFYIESFLYRKELNYWNMEVTASEINGKVGVNLSNDQIVTLLKKMCLDAAYVKEKSNFNVRIPPIRHDILHACDIVEDVAVAHGYNNIKMELPPTATVAGAFPLNKLTDLLRYEIAAAGFTEVLTFSLCSRDDISNKLRQPDAVDDAVKISNPKTLEFQVARTTLLAGILKTITYNKDMPLPLRLFEIQDVILKDPKKDVGARNERRFCAVYYGKTSGFEVIHGLLDKLMQLLKVPFDLEAKNGYCIRACQDSTFFDGRCASIRGPDDVSLGRLGVLHPEVIAAFELTMPASALEINLEPFL